MVNIAALLHAFAFVLFSGVSGSGKTQVSLLIELFVIIFYLITAYLLADIFRKQVYIVWMSEWIYAILLGILSYLYLVSGRWRSTKV